MPISSLFEGNRVWAESCTEKDPEFFSKLCGIQSPKFLWIGCSDSRVPANTIVNLSAGELFVHRNVANLVNHSDMNCVAVIQYAVHVLKVEHIIVTGHYGCGGIHAAMQRHDHGILESWLSHIRGVYRDHYDDLMALAPEARTDRLVELNVMQQVRNVSRLPVVQQAWENGQPLEIHGCVYSLENGILQNLGLTRRGINDLHPAHQLTAAPPSR
ncbi:MAG: carbonic anhydrase [Litorivicinus sp.]